MSKSAYYPARAYASEIIRDVKKAAAEELPTEGCEVIAQVLENNLSARELARFLVHQSYKESLA